MKKYLMIGAAALLMGASFTSCSNDKDLYDPTANAAKFLQDYQAAFISVFGQPAANQTWGFGNPAQSRVTRALGDYDNYKGSMQPVEWYQDTEDGWKWKTRTYTFPSDCDASKFLADVPGGVEMLVNAAKVNAYIDNTYTDVVNIWGAYEDGKTQGGTLYIKGDNDFSNRSFTVAINTDVYLLKGATLKLNDDAASTIKFNLYIAPGAKLIASGTNGRVKLDNGAQLYNHGEIECKTFEVNNTSMLYNGSVGKLTTTGEVYVANANSIIVNDGEITSGTESNKTGRLVTAGSGRVQNNAEWTVYGETIINSNFNIWVNNGKFITENYTYTATSSSVINNCFLIANENFCMNIADGNGDFKISNGGGVLTKNFYGGGIFTAKDNNNNDVTFNGGPFKVTMGSKSVFKVTETAYMNALGSGIATAHYGFDGVGDEYAVLEAQKVVRQSAGEGNVAYSGNLYVSAGEHFAQGYSGQYPYIHYYDGCTKDNIYAPGFESGKPSIKIQKTLCNPGFNGGDDPKPETESIRIMAEDVAASAGSDIDFNDVVFDVKATFPVENGAVATSVTTVSITIQAAGGTMPIYINGHEAHAELGLTGANAAKTMVNTDAKAYADGKNYFAEDGRAPASFDLTISDGISKDNFLQDVNEKIKITLQREGSEIVVIAHPGEPTAKIAVPVGTPWAKEKVNMSAAFGKFSEWVQTCSPTEWYKIYDGDMVIE